MQRVELLEPVVVPRERALAGSLEGLAIDRLHRVVVARGLGDVELRLNGGHDDHPDGQPSVPSLLEDLGAGQPRHPAVEHHYLVTVSELFDRVLAAVDCRDVVGPRKPGSVRVGQLPFVVHHEDSGHLVCRRHAVKTGSLPTKRFPGTEASLWLPLCPTAWTSGDNLWREPQTRIS